MSKNNQKVNEEVAEKVETTEVNTNVEEETKEGFGKKLLGGVKKHGKKIAAGAAVVAGGIICYAVGAKTGHKGESHYEDDVTAYYDLPESDEAHVAE